MCLVKMLLLVVAVVVVVIVIVVFLVVVAVILAIDWNEVISIENHNPDESFNSFFNKIRLIG